jgi:hypothetical protein
MFDKLPNMAFWMTETAGGGFAMGEAADEAEARMMSLGSRAGHR